MIKNERGIAMVAVLLVMLLMSALMVGFTAVVMSDQRFRGIDRDRSQAFYAAHSGLEKQTVDLHNLFFINVAPTQGQLNTLMAACPDMTAQGVGFFAETDVATIPTPCSGYKLRVEGVSNGQVQSGPYQGLIALKTRYNLDSTARTKSGGEVHLTRKVETVAIPVFQFGMFSDVDLSFFAGPTFNFGGRVHTNGNLFLSGGATLTLSEKVTAVGEIVRQRLSNGSSIDLNPTHNVDVSMARAAGSFRPLLRTEGSVQDGLGSALNTGWTNTSLSDYNGYIRNGKTGAKPLNLPVITAGGSNPDLVRRPKINSSEDSANPTLYGQRFYSQVSLRILLSDSIADLTGLPGATNTTPPVNLNTDWDAGSAARPAWYLPLLGDAAHPGLAETNGNITAAMNVTNNGQVNVGAAVTITLNNPGAITAAASALTFPATFSGTKTGANGGGPWPFTCAAFLPPNQLTGCNVVDPPGGGLNNPIFNNNTVLTTPDYNFFLSAPSTSTIGGYIRIERQAQGGGWTDVTAAILKYGFTARSQSPGCVGGAAVADPSPNAIIRLQRVSGFPSNKAAAAACSGALMSKGMDYWPLALFDTREAIQRDAAPASGTNDPTLGGVMYYVQIDALNLSRWFAGTGPPGNLAAYAAELGPGSKFDQGYSVYFSDRRNNHDTTNGNIETGEYGFEDVVNSATAAGGSNGLLDAGEDLNGDGVVQTYGQNPTYLGVPGAPPGAVAPMNASARPWTEFATPAHAQANRALLFRRALKLVNGGFVGGVSNLVLPGLTIVAENPIYVEGDWNDDSTATPGAASAIIGDTLTLLSNNWDDDTAFLNANTYVSANRPRSAQSYYRFATIAGKPPSFLRPTIWAAPGDFGTDGGAHNFLRMLEGGNGTVNYLGSIATFFYSRQATGVYKGGTVYSAPTRNFNFDTNFLNPALLPPLTPVFRDVSTLGFSQEANPLP